MFDLKQEAYLRWTRDRSRVNWYEFESITSGGPRAVVYAEAGRLFSVRSRYVLMNAQFLSRLCLARVRIRLFVLLLSGWWSGL